MANISKIAVNGTTYQVVDSNVTQILNGKHVGLKLTSDHFEVNTGAVEGGGKSL